MFPETKKLYVEVEEHLHKVLDAAPEGPFLVEGKKFKKLINALIVSMANLRQLSDSEESNYYIIEKDPKHERTN